MMTRHSPNQFGNSIWGEFLAGYPHYKACFQLRLQLYNIVYIQIGYPEDGTDLQVNIIGNQNKVTVNYDHQPPPMNEQRLVSNANELLQVIIPGIIPVRHFSIDS